MIYGAKVIGVKIEHLCGIPVKNDMQTLKLVIVFFAVAATILIIFGTADMKSQKRFAGNMNAPALVSDLPSAVETVDHTDPLNTKNPQAGKKTTSRNL